MSETNQPVFRIEKTNPPIVFLQCSRCRKDIRRISENETIRTTRAYHCEECDDGTIVLNPPTEVNEDDDSDNK